MKWYQWALLGTFILFIFLHFYNLPIQEFIGDEASPMLNVDRMWDAVNLHDIRFLAYPFLFYQDPFRSILSGTLLHVFGAQRVIDRLPSIIFGLLTFILLTWIFLKEKVRLWIISMSLIIWTLSGIVINNRSGGGDALTRFLILLSTYLIWKSFQDDSQKKFQIGIISWFWSILTMLDSFVVLPAIIATWWKTRNLHTQKTNILFSLITFLLLFYFIAWIALPYIAFKTGIQHYLSNRGLFYYFSRVNEGVSPNPFSSFQALAYYTSFFFELWVFTSFVASFFIKRYRFLQLVSFPAWLVVVLLSRSSFHVIMYAALFFVQAVLVTNYYVEKFPKTKYYTLCLLVLLIFTNSANFFSHYSSFYFFQNLSGKYVQKVKNQKCLDASVLRIYQKHKQKPLNTSCIYPRVQ